MVWQLKVSFSEKSLRDFPSGLEQSDFFDCFLGIAPRAETILGLLSETTQRPLAISSNICCSTLDLFSEHVADL